MTKATRYVDGDGVWVEILGTPKAAPALFLDRDGVVVVETHYLHEVEKTELIPGAGETIALANQRGIHVVLVTNQSGVGRGLYGWAEFQAVQDRIMPILRLLARGWMRSAPVRTTRRPPRPMTGSIPTASRTPACC